MVVHFGADCVEVAAQLGHFRVGVFLTIRRGIRASRGGASCRRLEEAAVNAAVVTGASTSEPVAARVDVTVGRVDFDGMDDGVSICAELTLQSALFWCWDHQLEVPSLNLD
ncbi:unnamed protein product [Microthlaspi erraticum]|uniref:Uncharacterized protein n=1 Tax=Microthlaspi erraticum TaxID=1685480 RepID=A0A6D2L8C1_9BRAS|nr:unnamed protein product [Microthlaspi erraticum]